MALTATGGNLIAAQQARQTRLTSSIDGMIKAIGARQERKDAERKQLVQQANTYTNNFVEAYGALDESSNAQWNDGARKWVSKAAARQSELYIKAYGDDGTVEDRNALRDQQLKDNAALKALGVFVVEGNSNTEIMNKNRIALNKGVALGALPRGTSTDLMRFQQGFNQNAVNKDGVAFNMGDDGQMHLTGTFVNGSTFDRNVSADAAATSEGIEELNPIGEDDLIEKVLGDRWHKGDGALGKNWETQTVSNTYWNKEGTVQTTSVTEKFDPNQVKEDLLGKYTRVLDADIKGTNFPKLWDQLYMDGYIKDENGNQMKEGQVAWKTVKQIDNMSVSEFTQYAKDLEGGGDYDGDGSITAKDQKLFGEQMNQAARNALANYYSETIAPQGNGKPEITSKEFKSSDDYTPNQRVQYEAYRRDYDKIENSMEDIKSKDGAARVDAIVKTLGSGYYTGTQLKNQAENDGSDDTNPDDYDENSVYTSDGGYYRMAISPDELKNTDDIDNIVINASSLPKGVQGYMQSHTKGGGLSYDTIEAARKAYNLKSDGTEDNELIKTPAGWKPKNYGKVN